MEQSGQDLFSTRKAAPYATQRATATRWQRVVPDRLRLSTDQGKVNILREGIKAAGLVATCQRLRVLAAIDAMPEQEMSARAVQQFLFDAGHLIPSQSLYQILIYFKRVGLLACLSSCASGRGCPAPGS